MSEDKVVGISAFKFTKEQEAKFIQNRWDLKDILLKYFIASEEIEDSKSSDILEIAKNGCL